MGNAREHPSSWFIRGSREDLWGSLRDLESLPHYLILFFIIEKLP